MKLVIIWECTVRSPEALLRGLCGAAGPGDVHCINCSPCNRCMGRGLLLSLIHSKEACSYRCHSPRKQEFPSSQKLDLRRKHQTRHWWEIVSLVVDNADVKTCKRKSKRWCSGRFFHMDHVGPGVEGGGHEVMSHKMCRFLQIRG